VERTVEYVRLDAMEPAPRNPKGHDSAGIARSIGHFGLAELPLLDERTGRLVAGHGRYEQLTTLEAEAGAPPDGIRVDDAGHWLMPVIRGWSSRSDDDAEAYLVASNQLTTKGGWNDHLLAEVLHDLNDAQMLELTGYEDKDLESLVHLIQDSNWTDNADPKPYGEPDDSTFWPKIDMQVAPDVFDAWTALLGTYTGSSDVEKLTAHLRDTGHYGA
jgi:hypothetical protein